MQANSIWDFSFVINYVLSLYKNDGIKCDFIIYWFYFSYLEFEFPFFIKILYQTHCLNIMKYYIDPIKCNINSFLNQFCTEINSQLIKKKKKLTSHRQRW